MKSSATSIVNSVASTPTYDITYESETADVSCVVRHICISFAQNVVVWRAILHAKCFFVVNAGLEKPWDRSPTGPKNVGSWGTWRGPDDYENGPFSKNSGSKIVGTVTFQFWRGSPWDP